MTERRSVTAFHMYFPMYGTT